MPPTNNKSNKHTGQKFSLTRPITAIPLKSAGETLEQLGVMTKLTAGLVVEFRGNGHSEYTARVCSNGKYYLVFVQDIESQSACD